MWITSLIKNKFKIEIKMTKITVLGSEPLDRELKPIVFVKAINHQLNVAEPLVEPSSFKNIELICRQYTITFDLMFCYDDDRNKGTLYLGYFNDGFVK